MKSSRQYSFYQFMLWLLRPYAASNAKKMDTQFLRNRVHERFGKYPNYRATEDQPIWIHAASTGEVRSAGVLITELRELGYEGHFIVTTNTPMGADNIEPFLQEGDQQFYSPYDRTGIVNTALDTFRPRMLISMEIEMWPALWLEAHARNIPIVWANARMSQFVLQKYQERMRDLWQETLSCATAIFPQSEQISERFRRLGANDQQLQIHGNLKFNQPVEPVDNEKLASLKQVFGSGRPIWLAANTHAGEEYLVLETHKRLLEEFPDLLLVILPREPSRFADVASGCDANNPNLQVRSDDLNAPILVETQVYLADTVGELAELYKLADCCFVGGSFCNIGGHNIIEPAEHECPITVGPMMFNFEDVTDTFLDHGALLQAQDEDAFYELTAELLRSEEAREKLITRAKEVISTHAGSGKAQAEAIKAILMES